MKLKTIDLFGKPLFNWVTMDQLVNLHAPMPEDEAAFAYVLEGNCINYSENDELRLKADQAVLAKCGNYTFKTQEVEGKTFYSAITIKFHKEVLEQVYQDSATPFFKGSARPLHTNSTIVEGNELLKRFVHSLIYYFDHQEMISEDLLVLKLKELIVLLLQTDNAPKVLDIMANLFEKKTFKFKEIIKAHIFSSLSIPELAQLTNHSLSAFKKEFKRIYNDTPGNYIIDQRIQKVAETLPHSDETLSNIAYDCEFKTLAHMSRVFKAKYGVSPSEYRLNFSDK